MELWTRWLPGLDTVRRYKAAWLPHDIFAGLVLATMLVPVGIAYAEASGLPGIYGLYATIVPLLAYALFGPSRILVLGPDSALAAIILGVVVSSSGGDPIRAAVNYFAGVPLDFWQRFEISVGSVTTIDLSDTHVQLQQVNEVPLPR